MKLRPHKETITFNSKREATPLRIIADAAIATGHVGDGKLVPLVILDTSERPDLEELIRVHEHLPPGDVDSQWAQVDREEGKVALILTFKRPSELITIINFDIVTQGGLVDLILTSKGLYLQGGRDGDRFSHSPNAPKILLEIPDTGFRDAWEDILHLNIVKDMRKKGMNRNQAKQAAREFVQEWRKFGSKLRIRP